ncbi:segregation/condensation protein A [Streptomyces sp. NPDC088915]|uniref:segregation and condensation protein A n=1 Tax=Streptomyces sp. NPDC088915 TaxID=3365912 RepID=UPI003813E4FF
MHHAPDPTPDETSRPPRRRTLGHGGGTGPLRGAWAGPEVPEPSGAPEAPAGAFAASAGPSGAPAGTSGAPAGAPEAPAGTSGTVVRAPEAAVRAPAPDGEPPGPAAELSAPSGKPAPAADREHPEPADGLPTAADEPPAAVAADEPPAVTDGPPATGPVGVDGRFTVRLSNFEGPFDLLLQLITKHKLDVTEVALSQVTDEFMAHLRALGPDGDLDQTTEFLVVAATLLDLKTARLLPAAEVEDEADLALLEARDLLFARLLQYRAYKRVAAIFEERWESEGRRHPRTVGLEPHHAELLPEVVISIGAEGFAKLAVKAMRPRAEPQVYVEHIHAPLVSVREQAAVVAALLRERGTAAFRELIEDAGDTLTVVARFLALLELYRERAVALDQETALGDLTVSWTGGDGEARVTDEFDQEPGQETEARA